MISWNVFSQSILDLNVLSHRLHGIDTRSKWLTSMCSLLQWPPLLYHISCKFLLSFDNFHPLSYFVSIIDFTMVSKSCISTGKSLVFGKTNARSWFLLAYFVNSVAIDPASEFDEIWEVFLTGLVEGGESFRFVSENSCWPLDPCKPFNCSSSAIHRKLSRFSWKTFASPWYRKSTIASKSIDFTPLI